MKRLLLGLILLLGLLTASRSESAVISGTGLPGTGNEGDCLLRQSGLWVPGACPGAGTGAPTTATYITETVDGTLSAEFALASLATGLLMNTTVTGVPSIYTGATCTNQVLRVLSTAGAGTCVTLTSAYVDTSIWTGTASSGILKASSQGSLATATAGTDYTSPSSTESPTNKTINCAGTGNSCTNVSLTTGVTGTLPVANGGTNAASFTGSRCVQTNAGGTALESSATACGSGSGSLNPTLVTVNAGNSPYTALTTDLTIACDTSAAGRTINLPAVTGVVLMIYNVGPNACTIARGSTDTILGATSLVLTNNDQSVILAPVSASNWGVF